MLPLLSYFFLLFLNCTFKGLFVFLVLCSFSSGFRRRNLKMFYKSFSEYKVRELTKAFILISCSQDARNFKPIIF